SRRGRRSRQRLPARLHEGRGADPRRDAEANLRELAVACNGERLNTMNRKKMLLAVTGAFAAGVVAYGAYWSIALRNIESTDNAYVNGNVVQITSQVAGTVVSIAADDTDFVKAGTTLVQLDTADAKVALDEAESQLAKTVRQV